MARHLHFTFTPMNSEDTPPKYSVSSLAVEQSKPNGKQSFLVLHLDDDISYLSVSKTILEQSADIIIDMVDSPFKAVEMALDGFYDILITDIQMPGMTGYEFIEAVRTINDEIPIIVLSSDFNLEKIDTYQNVVALSKQGEPKLIYNQIKFFIFRLGSNGVKSTR
jgi:CheY-like chemotaxis protein